ncbi:trimeric intracellular cation channel family protein [Nitrogeniibacter aestuarii]|uniref:trimeric intracellular cation channel family protein n=1 Tax=Nitrogeniibacter aestuarii TaxID=2815343 RepID=UPI001E3967F1|nr:trimeric intracellular cation channel family protein [Nitrogeniibacter aestuarii]
MPLANPLQNVDTLLNLSTAQTVIEAAAILAFAASGLMEAERKKLDLVGVCMVMGLTAFGGGTLRDVLLDRRPFFWVEHSNWLWAFLALGCVSMLIVRSRYFDPTERAMQWPDAVGLGLFAASGTQIALAASMPAIVAVLMGTISAAFGGVLRDIVCNEVPRVFSSHRPYAICAFVGAWCVVLADQFNAADWVGLIAGAAVTFVLRALALTFDWRLPGWRNP